MHAAFLQRGAAGEDGQRADAGREHQENDLGRALSAWCTAASTPAASRAAINASTTLSGFEPQVVASATRATAGTMSVHGTRRNQRGREPGAMTGIYCPQEPRSGPE